jgi:hypothetical protein
MYACYISIHSVDGAKSHVYVPDFGERQYRSIGERQSRRKTKKIYCLENQLSSLFSERRSNLPSSLYFLFLPSLYFLFVFQILIFSSYFSGKYLFREIVVVLSVFRLPGLTMSLVL